MRIIDADGCILGRMAVEAAKLARSGEEVAIVNAERAVVSGRKETVFARYLERRQRGSPEHGPFFPRTPERIVRRAVRGMIGYKSPEGKLAYGRVKAYVGVPEALGKAKLEKPAEAAKALNCDFVYVGEISKYLGYDYGR